MNRTSKRFLLHFISSNILPAGQDFLSCDKTSAPPATFKRTSNFPATFPAIFRLSVSLPERERLTLGRLESATSSNATVQQAVEALALCVRLKEREATTDGKVWGNPSNRNQKKKKGRVLWLVGTGRVNIFPEVGLMWRSNATKLRRHHRWETRHSSYSTNLTEKGKDGWGWGWGGSEAVCHPGIGSETLQLYCYQFTEQSRTSRVECIIFRIGGEQAASQQRSKSPNL